MYIKPIYSESLYSIYFVERHFAERTCILPSADILTNGLFAEKTFCRTDNLPKIEIFSEL